ncbi:MAG: DUF6291 domain-containing protein [Paludibacteraceae bacterium]
MQKKSFVFYETWEENISDLNDASQLKIYKAITGFAFKGEIPDLNPVEKMAFKFIKGDLERALEKYKVKTETNRENGKKGGAPKGNQNAKKKQPEKQPKFENGVGCFNSVVFESSQTIDNEYDKNEKQPKTTERLKNNPNDNEYEDKDEDNNEDVEVDENDNIQPVEILTHTISKIDERKLIERDSLFTDYLIRDTVWLNALIDRHNIKSNEILIEWLREFWRKLNAEGVKEKSILDAKSHFTSWLSIQLERRKKGGGLNSKIDEIDFMQSVASGIAIARNEKSKHD